MSMRYRIKYLQPPKVSLIFTVSDFEVIKGSYLRFVDEKTGEPRLLPVSQTEIKEIQDDTRHKYS